MNKQSSERPLAPKLLASTLAADSLWLMGWGLWLIQNAASEAYYGFVYGLVFFGVGSFMAFTAIAVFRPYWWARAPVWILMVISLVPIGGYFWAANEGVALKGSLFWLTLVTTPLVACTSLFLVYYDRETRGAINRYEEAPVRTERWGSWTPPRFTAWHWAKEFGGHRIAALLVGLSSVLALASGMISLRRSVDTFFVGAISILCSFVGLGLAVGLYHRKQWVRILTLGGSALWIPFIVFLTVGSLSNKSDLVGLTLPFGLALLASLVALYYLAFDNATIAAFLGKDWPVDKDVPAWKDEPLPASSPRATLRRLGELEPEEAAVEPEGTPDPATPDVEGLEPTQPGGWEAPSFPPRQVDHGPHSEREPRWKGPSFDAKWTVGIVVLLVLIALIPRIGKPLAILVAGLTLQFWAMMAVIRYRILGLFAGPVCLIGVAYGLIWIWRLQPSILWPIDFIILSCIFSATLIPVAVAAFSRRRFIPEDDPEDWPDPDDVRVAQVQSHLWTVGASFATFYIIFIMTGGR
ncbi:MAG: hypothetical protein ACREJQ_03655 [bacterium]